MKTIGLLFMVFWCYTAQLGAASLPRPNSDFDPYTVQIRHLTTKDGLPTNVINTGMQGRMGFIWLGTRDGLVQYDGEDFVQFTEENCGLSNNNIIRIAQIDDEQLWVLCSELTFDKVGGFVSTFNLITQKATPLASIYPEISGLLFQEIKNYNDTSLVLCTMEGEFYTYSPSKGFTNLNITTADPRNFMVAPDGLIWTAHAGSDQNPKGVVKAFNFKGNVVESRFFDFQILNLAGFDEDARPIVLIGKYRDNATHLMTLKKTGLSNIFFEKDFSKLRFSSDGLQFKQDGTNLWFGTHNMGIFKKQPGHTPELVVSAAECEQITKEDWRSASFSDKSGKHWIASNEGLFILSVGMDRFKRILSAEVKANMKQVRGICKDSEGNLYVSAGDFGEYKVTPDGKSEVVSHAESFLLSYADSDRVLFGNSRIEEYYPKTGRLTKHPRVGLGYLWCIFKDDNCWWLGGDGGIARSNTLEGPYKIYTDSIIGKADDYRKAYQIFRVGSKLWFVTAGGLYWYDEKAKKSGRVTSSFKGQETEWLDDIHQVYPDNNEWWIATNGWGLVRWNIQKNTFKRWSIRDGLPSNTIYAALDDEYGFLWISTNFGLVKFHKESGHIMTFTTEDGLPHHEFNRISWYKDESGYMYFGGLNGLIGFNPAEFTSGGSDYKAPLRVTSMFLYDDRNQELNDVTAELRATNRIKLLPANGFFGLKFKLLDFEKDRKRFVYKIIGLDEEWNELEDNQLQLANLPYGEYRLLIKGQNQAGMWSTSMIDIPLIVASPYYAKWWFILIMTLVGIGLITGIIRWRTWYLHKERNHLQTVVDEKTGKLQKSLEEKEVLLKEVHHRVKNNLQIISSLLNLEMSNENDPHSKRLLTEARHRIKSMALIHQNLYQFNDLTHIKMKDYLIELMEGLSRAYNKKTQNVTCSIEDNSVVLDVDTALPVGLIITELVSNSYKYAFEGLDFGEIKVQLYKLEDSFVLQITDNGIGLPPHLLSLNSSSLGLRLVKILSKQLKAKITISTSKGTCFAFKIPNLEYDQHSNARLSTADTHC